VLCNYCLLSYPQGELYTYTIHLDGNVEIKRESLFLIPFSFYSTFIIVA
jgi:hypothetical protein